MIIGNANNGGPKVYDVTNYLDDHPGGKEVMTDLAGKNADELFEDIGHSKEARKIMQKYLKGELFLTVSRHTFINFDINIFIYALYICAQEEEKEAMAAEASKNAANGGMSSLAPALVVLLAVAIFVYLKNSGQI
jgi:hypothetical protein